MSIEAAQAESCTARQGRTLIDVLYRKYHGVLRRFLTRQRVGREEVADIVQETYLRVWQSGNVDRIRNPRAFLLRVAWNVRLNSVKHRRTCAEEGALGIDGLDIASDEPGPYRSLRGEQELAIVRCAIEELAPKCRDAFIMNRFESMTFPQIAAELDLSVSMIEKHVSHAIAYLRQRLEDARPAAQRGGLRIGPRHE